MTPPEVVLDGVGPGVEALFGQALAQGDDLVLDLGLQLGGRGSRPAGLGPETVLALVAVAG